MHQLSMIFRRLGGFGNLAVLYAGKTSNMLVAFIFLPIYTRILGVDSFGTVAVILSLQSLLVMLDFGMATLVSREFSFRNTPVDSMIRTLKKAEMTIIIIYFLLMVIACSLKLAGGLSTIGWSPVLCAVLLFLVLVLQNIYYSAQVAFQSYRKATFIQISFVLIRAAMTVIFINYGSATIEYFLYSQLIVAFIHLLVSRHSLFQDVPGVVGLENIRDLFFGCWAMLNQGKTLLITGIAGAAAMQLDKSIIAIFMSGGDLTPYYLATTLSAIPITLLASPIVQYFQPKVINAMLGGISKDLALELKRFVIALLILVGMPTAFILAFIPEIVVAWIGSTANAGLVIRYARILLIAYAIAAVGYIPYVVIIANQSYKFQAAVSTVMSILLLTAVTAAASISDVDLVCAAYVGYFLITTGLLSFKAFRILEFQYVKNKAVVLQHGA